MKYLVLSDIHSNLVAFDAVLNEAGSFDAVWCLGDIVGYGPQPNECIERLQELPHVCVVGNHDLAALGRIDVSLFNLDAQIAALWTREQLTTRNRLFLEQLSEKRIEGQFTSVHGSPRHPVWEYVTSCSIANSSWGCFDTGYCFVGHTHVPAMYRFDASTQACAPLLPSANATWLSERMIINPGGVGQPRDGDPRASYALLHIPEMCVEFRRVEYAVQETQDLMRAVHLPAGLASRLSMGW